MLTSVVAAVIILALLIIVHETGHFLVAKRVGVRVIRFSIGYPPKLFGIRWRGTEYALSGTPLGGYVRMLGEEAGEDVNPSEAQLFLTEMGQDLVDTARRVDPAGTLQVTASSDPLHELACLIGSAPDSKARARELLGREPRPEEKELLEEVRDQPSSIEAIKIVVERRSAALSRRFESEAFPTQGLLKRFAIVLAGPLANILFAPILMAAVLMYGVPRLLPVIGEVKQDMPAGKAGLQKGDRIVSINNHPVDSWIDLSQLVKQSNGQQLVIKFSTTQGGAAHTQSVTLRAEREKEKTPFGNTAPQWVIGVMPRGDSEVHREEPFYAIPDAVVQTVRMAEMLVIGVGKIISGATPVRQALGGPIMIAKMAGQEARQGLADVGLFTVMLSLELGIINLLPVPMLDGGHLAFFAIEAVRGRPLQLRHREIAQQVGLFLLVVLMAFVIFNDISRIVQG